MNERRPMKVLHHYDRLAIAAVARTHAEELGLKPREVQEVVLCVAELASNAIRHGGGGEVRLGKVDEPFPALEVVVLDRGPGLSEARTFVERTAPRAPGDGLGAGLGAVRRLMTSVTIRIRDGGGTVVTALKRLP